MCAHLHIYAWRNMYIELKQLILQCIYFKS